MLMKGENSMLMKRERELHVDEGEKTPCLRLDIKGATCVIISTVCNLIHVGVKT